MRAYQHYQKSKLYIVLLGLLSIAFLCMYIDSGYQPVNLIGFTLLLFVMYGFSKMFVFVNDEYVKIRFGLGLFTKRILIHDIDSVKTVRNKWYYGWGIRFLYVPNFITLYSVFGLDAVEVTLSNGKVYRIGTDDTTELEKAIMERID